MMKKAIKGKIIIWLLSALLPLMFIFGLIFLLLLSVTEDKDGNDTRSHLNFQPYNGDYTEELPIFSEIKGTGNVPDEIAQLAVGSAVKYRLLPSVIISQWAYESEWGHSQSAKNDINFFGITWFSGCHFPQGSARGIGGSEGGHYMKFPNNKASFSYYGFMVASQNNFNACVGNKNPAECLLILGRGGYAAAGITENSPYFTGAMGIIESNNLTQYDAFAISQWNSPPTGSSPNIGNGDISILEPVLGQAMYNGECYGLTAYYVDKMGGATLMGSGFVNASDIGTDYDWEKYGWEVILNPKNADIQTGDIVNFQAGSGFAVPYGHTGICKAVDGQNVIVYDQWQGHGVTVSSYADKPINSIVRKVQ